MTMWLKQSTLVTIRFGPFLDFTDGVTPETGLATAMDNATTGIRVSKNGGNMIDRNNGTAPVHDEIGYYDVDLSTTDTNTLGTLRIMFSGPTVNTPGWQDFMVVTANVWDTFFGADMLQADVTQVVGATTNVAALATNVDAILTDTGTTIPATIADIPTVAEFNARTLVAASYFDPAADTVANVTTVATTTTNTDMVAAAPTAASIARLILPQTNTALNNVQFLMVLASDHVTAATGLTPVMTRSIDGGAFGAADGGTTITEVANGMYQVDLATADTNGTEIVYRFAVATADDTFLTIRYAA